VHPYNSAGTTISAVIGDNPNGTLGDITDDIPVSVTINNLASKPLTLSGLNTHSGITTINGNSTVPDGKSTVIGFFNKNKKPLPTEEDPEPLPVPSPYGTADSIDLNGAVIQILATGSGSSNRDIAVSGNSGFYLKGGYTQTLAGVISGTGSFSSDGDFGGSPGGTGNLVLAGANTFSGDVVFRTDSRITLAHADALQNATFDVTGLRILADLKTHNLAYNIGGLRGNVSVELGTGGAAKTVTVGGNHQSNSYAGVLSGDSGLTKTGSGTQTLLAANTYGSIATGSTVVAAGTLKLGAVAATIMNGSGSSGQKTITALSGTAGLAVGQAVSGGNVAPGAVIASIDSPTQVTVNLSHTAAFSAVPITFAAANGSVATPAIEVKAGAKLDVASQAAAYAIASTQTLGGAGTLAGAVSVNGKISPGVSSSPDAAVLLSDLDNSTATLSTGDVNFTATGEYKCTLDAADCDKLAAGTLTITPGAKISFTGTSAAASYVVATYAGAAPLPFATDATLPAGYSLDYLSSPGQIKLVTGGVVTPPYDAWAISKGLAGANAAATADPDLDGISNAIEFVIGGEPNPANPAASSSALLPSMSTTATHLVFSFRRTDVSLTQPGIAIAAAYDSDLNGWTTAQHGVNGVSITVTDDGFGTGVDKVDVSIPKSLASGSKMFARLTASF
jgi:autotransporter-associated beta strand protein